MQTADKGASKQTYVLLSGIEVSGNLRLSENVVLQPADTSQLSFNTAVSSCSRAEDIAVVAAFIPKITAQFHIVASTSKELVIYTINSFWDAILLSALFHTEIGFNLQSDVPAEKIGAGSRLCATNFYMYGMTQKTPHRLTSDECKWISANFKKARKLLDKDQFQTAAHCLASYRWHSMPRIKLAVLWAGIEGMFGASSEIRFRISLYIARFLYPDDLEERKQLFEKVKKLYDARSSAVHGSKIKGDISEAVDESAIILQKILIQCVESKSMPNEKELVP